MKQIVQTMKGGNLTLETVPPPALRPGGVLVRTAASLISAGTEKMLIDLAQKSLVGKAQARPDLVRQVLNKAQKEGWLNTYQNVRSKLEKPMPLGYSAAGIVESIGAEVTQWKVGDRVAIAGAGYANHAELNYVPNNLVASIPDSVSFEEAAYTTVASIALQGVRLARPELGDLVALSGLGLIGLITLQLLKANGCRVIGMDFDAKKVELARTLGLDEAVLLPNQDPVKAVAHFTNGRGVDHTVITASTTSNQPVEIAGELTRRKGQVVVVGAVGMNIPRDLYYKKELEVKISMSYGPGRYDPSYEEGGVDYPYDYVRWTEQRNMEAILNLMAQKRLNMKELTTHHFPFDQAMAAYGLIQSAKEPYVGVILDYDTQKLQDPVVLLQPKQSEPLAPQVSDQLRIGFVGAGNYATLHLLPHLESDPYVQMGGLVTATGINARQKADKFAFSYCSTALDSLLNDDLLHAIFIATRHGTHADYTLRALAKGKHVFVEKPMVVSEEELHAVCDAYHQANQKRPTALMVGLNRRFAPMTTQCKAFFQNHEPKHLLYRVNSGHIPTSSWIYDAAEGGGMLVGEMCHFIDLMQFITEERPVRVQAQSLTLNNQAIADQDNLTLTLEFDRGSVGTLCYNTVGDKAAAKERLEVYGGNKVAILDDFRTLELTRNGRQDRHKAANQNKGQADQMKATVEAFRLHGKAPIPFEELVGDMQVVFAAKASLATGQPVKISRIV